LFGNIVVIVFQNIFLAEMHQNNFFLFFKNYFLDQHIKMIQNIKKIIFNKKKLIFLKTPIHPGFQMLPLFFILLLTTHLDSGIGVEFIFFCLIIRVTLATILR
jgi:hypothetical protein